MTWTTDEVDAIRTDCHTRTITMITALLSKSCHMINYSSIHFTAYACMYKSCTVPLAPIPNISFSNHLVLQTLCRWVSAKWIWSELCCNCNSAWKVKSDSYGFHASCPACLLRFLPGRNGLIKFCNISKRGISIPTMCSFVHVRNRNPHEQIAVGKWISLPAYLVWDAGKVALMQMADGLELAPCNQQPSICKT